MSTFINNQCGEADVFNLIKNKFKKNDKFTTINLDQLMWYFTPFNLEIIGRLIEVNFHTLYSIFFV